MERVRFSLVLSLVLLTIGLGLSGPAQALWIPRAEPRAEPRGKAWQEPPNLLQNPGFEGDYYPWFGINEVQVAHGWTPWWRTRTEADPPAFYFKPEYKRANVYVYPNRVHGGTAAQQWFTFYATHQAGMYQQVFNVTPGTRYRFTIWAQAWSSTEDDPNVSVDPAYPFLRVGIDPTGSWDPWAGTVIWSGSYHFFDSWGQLAVEAVAQNNVITVFMRSEPNWPVKHNDTYWDDAVLVAVGAGGVPIQPTPTPTPPSETPVPTASATPGGPAPPTATPAAPPPPTPTCAPSPEGWVTYHVQRGDTLYGLAQRHGTTLEAVIAANCLRTTTIFVGQALLLPPLAATATPAAEAITVTATRPTATARPTTTRTATPRAAPPTPSPSTIPATATPARVSAATLTRTAAPPFTPTLAPTAATPTAAPSGGGIPSWVAIVVGAGLVLSAGVFYGWRRKRG